MSRYYLCAKKRIENNLETMETSYAYEQEEVNSHLKFVWINSGAMQGMKSLTII